MTEQLLNAREVAERLRLSLSMVWALIARGDIPSITIGRARRVPASQLDAWIAHKTSTDRHRPGVERKKTAGASDTPPTV